jgi:hypothetical protein
MKYGLFYFFLQSNSANWPYHLFIRLSLTCKSCNILSESIPLKNLLIVAPTFFT